MEDSCYIRYQNKNITLTVDLMYGSSDQQRRSTRSEFSGKRDFRLERATINGQKAEVMTWYEADVPGREAGLNYLALLFMPGVEGEHSELTIFTYNRSAEARAISRKIFESVKFD